MAIHWPTQVWQISKSRKTTDRKLKKTVSLLSSYKYCMDSGKDCKITHTPQLWSMTNKESELKLIWD